jgi:Fe-S oxidoreductase
MCGSPTDEKRRQSRGSRKKIPGAQQRQPGRLSRVLCALLEDTGADTMISACANCRLTMDESKAYWHWERGLDSLVEILAENLAEAAAKSSA